MYNCLVYFNCTHGEMDITTVFGTVIGGSNPSGCTKTKGFYAPKRVNCFTRERDSKGFSIFRMAK